MNSSAAALLALRAWRSTSLSSTNNGWMVNRTLASGKGSTTKSGSVAGAKSSSATASAGVNVDGKNLDPPSNVFKQVDKSALGPGASKQSDYKNPEYFSYHEMSYTEMEIVMAKHRVPQPSASKK